MHWGNLICKGSCFIQQILSPDIKLAEVAFVAIRKKRKKNEEKAPNEIVVILRAAR